MLLLKPNSTEEVASCINSTKMSRGNDGCGKTLLLYRASAQDLYGFGKRNIGEVAGNVKGTEENRGGIKGKVSDFFYKGKRIQHAVDKQVLKDWLEKTGKPFSQLMLGRSCH